MRTFPNTAPIPGSMINSTQNLLVPEPAGAGLVRVRVDGRGLGRSLTIDPEAFEGRDAELLADLIVGAVAEAQRRASDLVQAEMRKLSTNPLAAL